MLSGTTYELLVVTCWQTEWTAAALLPLPPLQFYSRYEGQPVIWHSQVRTGGVYWRKLLLPTCPCWWQLVPLDLAEDAEVFSIVTFIVSWSLFC